MLQEQASVQHIQCCNFDSSLLLRLGSKVCLNSLEEKVALDLRYRDFTDPYTYFFDGEGKVMGVDRGKYVASLLRRLSDRVEGLTVETLLKSTLFGSISRIQI